MGRFNLSKPILNGLYFPYHCRIQLGGIVSVPRARLSPPCFHRTGVDAESGVSSALVTGMTSTVSRALAPGPCLNQNEIIKTLLH